MVQQTAIDYFKDELIKQGFFVPGGIYAQAKAMEKEQIITAYINGELQQGYEAEAEQYYNETYNK